MDHALSLRKNCSLRPRVYEIWSQKGEMHDPTVISFDWVPACDGRTDGQTHYPFIAKSVVCIADTGQNQ